ncbi:acyl-CoA-binding domain-containing protein 4-like isoform X2 [Colius striatus]|uniref:acyl-CoA-binding domain-containing protein 4-like isoform X2 n=1 Tax=Colius striatus TaxID=57412 RepID=UPI002B1D857D|nr:acyl-CoA-binding domain-containing protein 4-like isoform X2 [Colius striatus]
MDEPGCGEQFRAAVRVIQGLPRSGEQGPGAAPRPHLPAPLMPRPAAGSYRPSYEEMLRFYSYYKQATVGCCQGPRPGFWDPIGRYKWDAWHSLGSMSKEEAMAAYVAEMKKVAQKVIDTVPMDEATEEMFRYFEPLYDVIHDMPRPPEAFFKRKRGSQEQSPDPGSSLTPEQQDGPPGPGRGPAPATKAAQATSDSEGDVYCDTLEQMEPEQALGLSPNGVQAGPPLPPSTGQGQQKAAGRRLLGRSSAGLAALGSQRDACLCPTAAPGLVGAVLEAGGLPGEPGPGVAGAVRALQDDMRRVLERLSALETLTQGQGDAAGTDPDQAVQVCRTRLRYPRAGPKLPKPGLLSSK